LNDSITFFFENGLEFLLHLRSNDRQILEEITSRELRRLIVKAIDCVSNAWALVVISVSEIEVEQVLLVQLILELGTESNHKSIGRSRFNRWTNCFTSSGEIKGLHDSWVLNELVHEPKIMEPTSENIRTYLF